MDFLKRIDEEKLFSSLSMFEPHNGLTKDLSPAAFPNRAVYIVTDQTLPPSTVERLGAKMIVSLEGLSSDEISHGLFYVYFGCDSDALPVVRAIQDGDGIFIPHLDFTKTEYRFTSRRANDVLRRTWAKNERVSHLNANIHENICEAIEITSGLTGAYVEIGVFRGGSALTALHYMDAKRSTVRPRKAWLFDTFDGFNYAEARSSADALWANTHSLYGADATMAHVHETLKPIGVPFALVKSNICVDDLPDEIDRISVANIDVDMYEPTVAALEKTADRLEVGGIIIAEDAASTPGLYGALVAMEEFLASSGGQNFYKIFKGAQYFLIKMR